MFTSVELKNMKFKENVRKIVSHKELSENLREIFIFIEFFFVNFLYLKEILFVIGNFIFI